MSWNSITLNVLSDITKKINNGDSYNRDKKILVVITGSNFNTIQKIREIKHLKEKGYTIDLAFSFMSEKILDAEKIISELEPRRIITEEDIFNLEKIVNEYIFMIGINVTINTVSKISSGMIDNLISTIAWSFLYDNKEVYFDYSNVREFLGKKTQNSKIQSIIDSHINILNEMGVKEIRSGYYLNTIIKEEAKTEEIILKTDISKNRVITVNDLEKNPDVKILKLNKGDIITPLAVDKAKKMGMTIERVR